MPVAIAQYPDFFNNNRWLLPLSVALVVFLWVFPLFIHDNAKRCVQQFWKRGWLGKVIFVVLVGAIMGGLWIGSKKLFRMHADHLDATLKKQAGTTAAINQPTTPSDSYVFPIIVRGIDFDTGPAARKQVIARVHYLNTTSASIQISTMYEIFVVSRPPDEEMDMVQDRLWRMFEGLQLRTVKLTVPPGAPLIGPMLGQMLSTEEYQDIKRGKAMVVIAGGMQSTDNNGLREVDFFSWSTGDLKQVVLCRYHNGPTKPTRQFQQ